MDKSKPARKSSIEGSQCCATAKARQRGLPTHGWQPAKRARSRRGASSTVLSHEGIGRQATRPGGIRPSIFCNPGFAQSLAGLRTCGPVMGVTSSAHRHLLAIASQSTPVDQCFIDGGRFRLPLRGSPGFTPGSLLSRPQYLVVDQ